jgi:hypothetical protein
MYAGRDFRRLVSAGIVIPVSTFLLSGDTTGTGQPGKGTCPHIFSLEKSLRVL